eukprot:TRINITY_DN8198_c0_g1_i1.p1 TRINITY_DN8198_c0_g1~~TRINITY_DN8198_c0_g1_i1.p1  ORF type:complete len:424 (-),score=111.01 TRINITY_DN8198_c0_g1_i1:177-1421(-)
MKSILKDIVQFDNLMSGAGHGFKKVNDCGEEKVAIDEYLQDYIIYHTETIFEPVGVLPAETEEKSEGHEDEKVSRDVYQFSELLSSTLPYARCLQRDLANYKGAFEREFESDVPLAFHAYTTQEFHCEVNTDLREMVTDLGKWQSLLFNILLGKHVMSDKFVKKEKLFRGQKEWYHLEKDIFVDGARVTFNTITSTSTSSEVARSFAGETGVTYEIEGAEGIDVFDVSEYPDENEIVLLPGSTFEVVGRTDGEVKLRYVGLQIPEVMEKLLLPFMLESSLHHGKETLVMPILKRMRHLDMDLNMELPGRKENRSAMYYAAKHGLAEVLKYLVADLGLPTFQRIDEYDSTPLHAAAFYGHEACVRILLAAPDISLSLRHKNSFDYTPVQEAEENVIYLVEEADMNTPPEEMCVCF